MSVEGCFGERERRMERKLCVRDSLGVAGHGIHGSQRSRELELHLREKKINKSTIKCIERVLQSISISTSI